MPYRSRLKARAMHAKAERGEIPKSVVNEFDRATNFKRLPERAKTAKTSKPVKRK